jgi:hypothetical protein
VLPRSCLSLPVRCIGALGHAVASKLMTVGMLVPSLVRPNPSVERTSNGGARLRAPSTSVAPLAAAHLKR